MNPAPSPMKRFILHSLWMVLPFCALLAITWNAWRADAETRKNRMLEAASQLAARTLDETRANLGAWSPMPVMDRTGLPPLPHDDPKAVNTEDRPDAVQPHRRGQAGIENGRITAKLPKLSWNVIRLKK